MAIFSKKTKTDKKADSSNTPDVVTKANSTDPKLKGLIEMSPRVAEKSALLSDKGVYTFVVGKDATKNKVAKAVEVKYKVKPVKVNITNLPSKVIFSRGKWGKKSGVKKAVVFLKKGDKIEFM